MAERYIEYMPLDVLQRAPRNPKDHDKPAIAASLKRFGYVEAIALDDRTGRLVAGHGRLDELELARSEAEDPPEGVRVDDDGNWWVPVQRGWESKDDAEAEAYVVASNAIGEGLWHRAELADVLKDLQAGPGLDGVGYDAASLDALLASLAPVEEPAANTDVDDVPMLPAEPIAKAGDVWLLGPHRLACGDSTHPDVVADALGGRSIDMVFTSPPYNVGVEYDEHDDADGGRWEDYEPMLRGVVSALSSHLAPGRALCWNIGVSPKTHHARQHMLIESMGMTFVRQMVWHKVGVPVPTWYHTERAAQARRFTPNYTHELVLIFAKGDDLEPGGPVEFGDVLEHDVFRVNQASSSRGLANDPSAPRTGAKSNLDTRAHKVHPAPFPVELPRVFMAHLADVGAVVFDPFAGVASTIIAAHHAGRVGVGVELSPAYVDAACERYQRHTGVAPVLEATGEAHDFARAVPRVADPAPAS